jgi:hypothetical protein
MKMAVFWVVAPCSLVEVCQRFKGNCCLHHQWARQADLKFAPYSTVEELLSKVCTYCRQDSLHRRAARRKVCAHSKTRRITHAQVGFESAIRTGSVPYSAYVIGPQDSFLKLYLLLTTATRRHMEAWRQSFSHYYQRAFHFHPVTAGSLDGNEW